jgi:hypothetical protein
VRLFSFAHGSFLFFDVLLLVVISKDPDDPNKTRIALLAHADPGGGLPQWVRISILTYF